MFSNMSSLGIIFLFLIVLVCIFIIAGYCVYKVQQLNSWEEGIKKVLTWVSNAFIEEITGNPSPDKIIATQFILHDDEVIKFLLRFDNMPYLAPTITSYIPNENGVSYYDFSTLGLASSYKGLSPSDLEMMCRHIIKGYFIETRKWCPYINILVASPNRLHFAIALSEDAKNRLNVFHVKERNTTTDNYIPLEEQVTPLKGDHHDNRI